MKIYAGWVLSLGTQEVVVIGFMAIRGTITYILKDTTSAIKSSMKRDEMINGLKNKSIQYVKSVSI